MNTMLEGTTSPGSDSAAPQPLHTTRIECESGDGLTTHVVRDWAQADARACRLCPPGECKAQPTAMLVAGRDGRLTRAFTCTVSVHGFVPSEAAPLFSTHRR